MSEFYIASYSLDEDSLCHYGRPGMKWYQHIFGKEPTGRYTAKKRAKMVKKYGEKGARLREAKSVNNAYSAARYRDKKNKYGKSDYLEYQNTMGDIVREGTTYLDIVKKVSDANKKEVEAYGKYMDADNKAYNHFVDTQNAIRDAVDNNKELSKEWHRKRDKDFQILEKEREKTQKEYWDLAEKRIELTKEWVNDVFGTTLSDNPNGIEARETGMNFIASLPDSFYEEFDNFYNPISKIAEEKRKGG